MDNSVDRLSYLQAAEYEYTTADHTFNPIKNLNDLFVDIEDCDSQNLRVYLRVRPSLPDENIQSEEFQVDLLNKNSVVLTAPASSNTFKNASHGIAKLSQKFTFSHIYGPTISQKELFEESTLGLVNDFVTGQNILLFTYGATNSGKTFTVQGTPTDPGILPRTLDLLFKSIGEKHYPQNDLKPRYFCGISRLEEKDIKKEEEKKQRIFKIGSENGSRFSLSISNLSKFSNDFSLNESQPSSVNTSGISSVIEVPCQEDISIEISDTENTVYAVFVSFAEIYNEYIYDLLEQMPSSQKKKRDPLTLGEDRNASIYIKGLQEVRVNSAEEAWQLLEIGRQNLHFAATRLNHNSSRSHCIFTIKVVRLADASNPHVARVSMMSICDLAGAERAGKTKSNQDRLKEAGNINSSLLVLSRCLDALRQNQLQKVSKKREVPVPYRDSKLTRLFQSFFLGRGKAAMIVNISKSPLMFDETLQVLKFSAIAKQVAVSHSKQPECLLAAKKRPSQFSKFIRQSLNTSGRLSVPWMKDVPNISFGASEKKEESMVILEEEEEEEEEEEDERYEALLKLIGQLRDKLIQEHKAKGELEDKLREELCNEFSQQLVEVENSYSQRLKEQQSRMEEFSEYRINALMKSVKKTNGRKRLRPDTDPDEEYVPSIDLFQEQQKVKEQAIQIEELEMEMKHFKEEVEAMKHSQKKTNEKASRAQEENSKLTFQLAQLTRSLERAERDLENTQKTISPTTSEDQEIKELKRRLDESRSLLSIRDSEIKEIKEMLGEAAEEFIIKEEEIQNFMKAIEKKEKTNTKQLMSLNELESQLSEAREILSQHAMQLEERDQHISELQEQLSVVQNVEDVVSEVKDLRSVVESYRTQVLILEQSLTATEKERNKAEKVLEDTKIKKRQIEEDYLRDKSKLLLEVAGLKRNGNQNIQSYVDSTALREALVKVTQLQQETDALKEEKGHLQNQLTESKTLFEHLKSANSQLESYQKVLLKEKEDLQKELDELSMKLMTVQDERVEEQLDTSALKTNNVNITNQVNTLKNKIQDNDELLSNLNEELMIQKLACEDAKQEREKLEILNEELSQKVESLKSSMDTLAGNEILHEKLESLEKELALVMEDLQKEREANSLLKEKEELLHKVEEEKESVVGELSQERNMNVDIVESLKSEVDALKADLENVNRSLEEKNKCEDSLLNSLHEKEAELEENVCTLNKQKSLEEEIKLLKLELEKTVEASELKKLSEDSESERTLKEQIESQKCELDKVLLSKKSELEKCECERESIREELNSSKESLLKIQQENEENMKKLTEEKNCLVEKFSELERMVGIVKEEKCELERQLEKTERRLEEMKGTEAHLRTQVLEVKEAESHVKEQKLSSQEELLCCKEDLLAVRASVATLKDKNDSLREKFESTTRLQEELSLKVKEKEEVIVSLNAKVESLDRKLNHAEGDSEKKERALRQELIETKSRCDVLEKEVRAVREARQEEVSQYCSQVEVQEDQLRQKDTEVSTLQQEVKKLLQQSMTSSMCNISQNTLAETPKVKREAEEEDKSVLALKEEVRLKAKNESLVKEVTDLRSQLEMLSLSYSSVKPSPARSSQRKALQMVQSDSILSDGESVSIVTPAPRSRTTRKTRTPAITPVKTPVQLDSTTEEFVPHVRITSTSATKNSSRPQRASRRLHKINTSFEYDDFEDEPLVPVSREEEKKEQGEDSWVPSGTVKIPAKGGRKARSRKPKASIIFNPHLNNQENKSILANQSQESQEDFKSPQQRRKRHLFKSVDDELYMGSPVVVEIPRVEDSPHSVVRRQLRSKRK